MVRNESAWGMPVRWPASGGSGSVGGGWRVAGGELSWGMGWGVDVAVTMFRGCAVTVVL